MQGGIIYPGYGPQPSAAEELGRFYSAALAFLLYGTAPQRSREGGTPSVPLHHQEYPTSTTALGHEERLLAPRPDDR